MAAASTQRRNEGKPRFGLISACVVGFVALGAIWLSHSRPGNDATVAPLANDSGRTQAPGTETAQAGRLPEKPDDDVQPDDDIAIALGGSWENYDCTLVTKKVVRASTGETVDALACERAAPKPVHPYESYSDEALESLAYSDPIAAIILGRRVAFAHPDEAWEHMIRSSAMLGGDSRPIRWLATRSFNRVSTNGEIAVDDMQIRYVLDAVTRRLDNNPDQPSTFRDDYLRSTLSDTEMARLNRMVEDLIRKMQIIEEETNGNSTITG